MINIINNKFGIYFRNYTSFDYKNCIELFEINCPLFFADVEKNDYIRFLKYNKNLYIVGYKNNVLICCFGINNLSNYFSKINWIMVNPNYQKQGFGKLIMSYIINTLKKQNIKELLISTSHITESFFLKYNAERIKFTAHGWGKNMHKVEMKILIKNST